MKDEGGRMSKERKAEGKIKMKAEGKRQKNLRLCYVDG